MVQWCCGALDHVVCCVLFFFSLECGQHDRVFARQQQGRSLGREPAESAEMQRHYFGPYTRVISILITFISAAKAFRCRGKTGPAPCCASATDCNYVPCANHANGGEVGCHAYYQHCMWKNPRVSGSGVCYTWQGDCAWQWCEDPQPAETLNPTTTIATTPVTTTPVTVPTTTPVTTPVPVCAEIYINRTIEVEKIIYKSWQEDPGRKDWGRPGHSHCVQPYTWDELSKGYKDKYIPYKVGGLGKLLEPDGYETWVCLLDDHPCGDPHYCWVYHETDKVFTAWGTNTELGLHFK